MALLIDLDTLHHYDLWIPTLQMTHEWFPIPPPGCLIIMLPNISSRLSQLTSKVTNPVYNLSHPNPMSPNSSTKVPDPTHCVLTPPPGCPPYLFGCIFLLQGVLSKAMVPNASSMVLKSSFMLQRHSSRMHYKPTFKNEYFPYLLCML